VHGVDCAALKQARNDFRVAIAWLMGQADGAVGRQR